MDLIPSSPLSRSVTVVALFVGLLAAGCVSETRPNAEPTGEGPTAGPAATTNDTDAPSETDDDPTSPGDDMDDDGAVDSDDASSGGDDPPDATTTSADTDADCVPECVGRDCGDDGCGGSCGECGDGTSCVEPGLCIEGGAGPGCREADPQFAATTQQSSTILIDEPGVYDFEGVLHEWTGSGDCIQQENQPYVLRIAASDVTVRNFAYRNAPDGIHIGTSSDGQGHSSGSPISNIVLENITGWACEDAMTIQKGVQDVTIRDSLFLPNPDPNERDKLLQLNFGDVTIERSTFYGGGENGTGTCLMFKGGQNVEIRDSCFVDCDRAINGSTINGIVGDISEDHSELLSVGNEGHFSSRADTFWDPWKMFTAEGDVHATSRDDALFDNPVDDFEFGASIDYE